MKARLTAWPVACALLIAAGSLSAQDGPRDFHKPADAPTVSTGVTYINGPGVRNQKVVYENVNGLAIFEGDILLGTVEEAEAWNDAFERRGDVSEKSVFIDHPGYYWPSGLIPFVPVIDVPADLQADFEEAAQHWTDNTKLNVIPTYRLLSFDFETDDYVAVVPSASGCFSHVGRQGGMQTIGISSDCSVGEMIHLIGHTVGLWHEHSRADRDRFVRVNWANIEPNQDHNFYRTHLQGVGHYDYGSIMHPGRHYFSRNGQATLVPINENGDSIPASQLDIGQRQGLSPTDIDAVNRTYFPNFTFYEGNAATQERVCAFGAIAQTVKFKQDGFTCENDEARSVRLNHVPPGVSLVLYDDPDCHQNDDWTVIRSLDSVTNFIVPSFESALTTGDVKVTPHPNNGLDGKVSCVQVTVCGDNTCEGLESCVSCPSDCGQCPG
ncbi:MAG: M12 family metallopeptidase, partial [Acidobacteriota bacterium]